jgi:hypothetical protein
MKNLAARSITALALVGALGVSVPAAAYADSSSTTTTTAPSAWTTWHATWVAYANQLKAIRLSYRTSVASARLAYSTALASATTKAERQAARATLESALSADVSARVAAITAAGDPPAPPTGYNGTAFVAGIQAANDAFRASSTTAESAYAQAIAGATTSAQRRTARLTLEAAIDNALVVRINALTAMGTPPTHPGKSSS